MGRSCDPGVLLSARFLHTLWLLLCVRVMYTRILGHPLNVRCCVPMSDVMNHKVPADRSAVVSCTRMQWMQIIMSLRKPTGAEATSHLMIMHVTRHRYTLVKPLAQASLFHFAVHASAQLSRLDR